MNPTDPFTAEFQLCDDAGMVSHERVARRNPFNSDLTYLEQLRNLQSHTRETPLYRGEPFVCTGSAHLAGLHIRCTSPAHEPVHLPTDAREGEEKP